MFNFYAYILVNLFGFVNTFFQLFFKNFKKNYSQDAPLDTYVKIRGVKLIPTEHFKERIVQRNISWKECEETVKNPDSKKIQGKGVQGGVRYIYEKKFKTKTMVVVVGENVKTLDIVYVITAWKKD